MNTPINYSQQSINRTLSSAAAIVGNLSLVWLFFSALLWPQDHIAFIGSTGAAIFLFEFLSIHSTGMLMNADVVGSVWKGRRFGFLLLAVYVLFTGAFYLSFRNLTMPIMFLVSVVSKLFGARVSDQQMKRAVLPMFPFIGWSFVVFVIMPGIWTRLFILPQDIAFRPSGGGQATGLMVDHPQLVLVWGMFYFLTLALMETYFFLKPLRPSVRLRNTNLDI